MMLFSPNDTESRTHDTNGSVTPFGIFFSDNQPTQNESRLNLKFSPDLFSDSLFIKQPETLQPVIEELNNAHIYFPDAVTTQDDTISWSLAEQHSQSFENYYRTHQNTLNAAAIESIILEFCIMVHHIHNNNAADYPISSEMVRFNQHGEPMMLLMPNINPEPVSQKFKGTLFSSNVGAPEIQGHTCMNPQAFAFNVGMLAAQLMGYQPAENTNKAESLQALITWLKRTPAEEDIAKLQKIILQTLQPNPHERPYCPMKIYKAITGTQPFDCQE